MPEALRTSMEACHHMVVAFNRSSAYLPNWRTWLGLGDTRLPGVLWKTRWLRLAAIMVWFATFAGGCAALRIDNTTQVRVGQAFCLRGLLDVFSLGLNDLSRRLRGEGLEARAVSGPAWPSLARKIRQARLEGRLQEPLILIGHSYGADDAIRLARKLSRWNIDVELLVLLDATTPPRVPSNVDRCLHLYRPTVAGDLLPFVFAGNPVNAEEGNHRTVIVNKIISRENFGAPAARIGHLNLDSSAAVHDLVVKEILRICPPGAAWEQGIATGVSGQPGGISHDGR